MSVTNIYRKIVSQGKEQPAEPAKPPSWVPGHALQIGGAWFWSTAGKIHSWSRSDSEDRCTATVLEHVAILRREGIFECHATEARLALIEL